MKTYKVKYTFYLSGVLTPATSYVDARNELDADAIISARRTDRFGRSPVIHSIEDDGQKPLPHSV